MAFVTEDERVRKIVGRMTAGKISEAQARQKIKALAPQKNAKFGYLDWEVDEAISSVEVAAA